MKKKYSFLLCAISLLQVKSMVSKYEDPARLKSLVRPRPGFQVAPQAQNLGVLTINGRLYQVDRSYFCRQTEFGPQWIFMVRSPELGMIAVTNAFPLDAGTSFMNFPNPVFLFAPQAVVQEGRIGNFFDIDYILNIARVIN